MNKPDTQNRFEVDDEGYAAAELEYTCDCEDTRSEFDIHDVPPPAHTSVTDGEHGFQLVTLGDPMTTAIVDFGSWQELALDVGKSIVLGSVSGLLDRYRDPQAVALHESAKDAIAKIVQAALKRAFFDDYLTYVRANVDRLQDFADTKEERLIQLILDESGRVIHGLESHGYPGLSGYVMAVNAYLAALRCRADAVPSYQTVLVRKRRRYGKVIESFAGAAQRRLEGRVSHCEHKSRQPNRHIGPEGSAKSWFKYDWGKRTWEKKGDYDEKDAIKQECRDTRKRYHGDLVTRTISREINPILELGRRLQA